MYRHGNLKTASIFSAEKNMLLFYGFVLFFLFYHNSQPASQPNTHHNGLCGQYTFSAFFTDKSWVRGTDICENAEIHMHASSSMVQF